jgi:mRNA interferase RelE/StbE
VRIDISKAAARSLKRSNKRKLIAGKIMELAAGPEALSANVVKLKGREGFRLRVQDWRVVFRIEQDVLHVDEIEPRGAVYEDRS